MVKQDNVIHRGQKWEQAVKSLTFQIQKGWFAEAGRINCLKYPLIKIIAETDISRED